MKRICAWCKKDIGACEGPEDQVTHGVCDDCAKVLRAEAKQLAGLIATDVAANAEKIDP